MKRATDSDGGRNDASYRLDMINAADEIRTMTRGVTEAAFLKSLVLIRAVERDLGVIGEAASKFSIGARRQYPDVPWEEIVGLRTHLIHFYFTVDPSIVWNTAKKDAPELARALRRHELKKTSLQIDSEIERMLKRKKKR